MGLPFPTCRWASDQGSRAAPQHLAQLVVDLGSVSTRSMPANEERSRSASTSHRFPGAQPSASTRAVRRLSPRQPHLEYRAGAGIRSDADLSSVRLNDVLDD